MFQACWKSNKMIYEGKQMFWHKNRVQIIALNNEIWNPEL